MGRYGMAGDHYRQSGYVTLQDVPDPNREYIESFDNLVGGMNRFDLDYALKGNESPFLQNMSWHNGTLTSRLGQVVLEDHNLPTDDGLTHNINYVSVAPFLFHGWMLVQGATNDAEDPETVIYAVKIRQEQDADNDLGMVWPVWSAKVESPQLPGTFFRYREDVFFKAKGVYIKIFYQAEADVPVCNDSELVNGYVPIIQKNTDPDTGAGDPFQQENRLTPFKKVEFNVNTEGRLGYQLPISNIDSTRSILAFVENGTDNPQYYEVNYLQTDYENGLVFLKSAPPSGSVLTIQFYKNNAKALDSLADSSVAIVFGGAQDLCVVMGGPASQPNAYFWSGHNGNVMDPTYFPMNQYNLAGDNDDPITAFGKQQNMLVIFQPHAVGRAVFGTETLDGLVQVTMNYTRINAEIGCDLPGSLQLVDNNLVWCSRRYGVCRLKDSSAAYENNIVQISRKINGGYRLDGLLEQLKSVADDEVRSVDTGKRYILVLGDEDGKAYEWNYELSQYDNPSWFFHTNILGVGFVPLANEELYEVTADGKVCTFEPVFQDFGESAIEKIYRFPPRDFGGYDRLKNIKSILVTTRSDAPTNTVLKYTCDYKERTDPTNLVVNPNERNFAVVFRRKPGFHNIHHLGIEMSNNTAGEDLNLLSAKIFYEYRGRQR